jgi:predicted RNA methylase
MSKKISEDVLRIISEVTITGNTVLLPEGQLDRTVYLAVNEVLSNIGGKWNREAKGHVFDTDPTGALEMIMLTGETVNTKAEYGCFYTPPELARRVVELAEIKPGMFVLEPSAGRGALVEVVYAVTGEPVWCAEILHENIQHLAKLPSVSAINEIDFLTTNPSLWPRFDRVVMNPPFAGQADIEHVSHALRFLRPGGILVAIMSAGVLFRENLKTVQFRAMVNEGEYRAEFTRNAEDAFKESGTGVNTVIAVIRKKG